MKHVCWLLDLELILSSPTHYWAPDDMNGFEILVQWPTKINVYDLEVGGSHLSGWSGVSVVSCQACVTQLLTNVYVQPTRDLVTLLTLPTLSHSLSSWERCLSLHMTSHMHAAMRFHLLHVVSMEYIAGNCVGYFDYNSVRWETFHGYLWSCACVYILHSFSDFIIALLFHFLSSS